MAKAYFLTDDDRRLIQSFLDRTRNLRINTPPNSSEEDQDFPTDSTYIALTPGAGIPALTEASGTAIGTGTEGAGDKPGSATCNIYQIVNGILQLLPSGLNKTIYNLSTVAIQGSFFILVTRTKFGHWVAVVPPRNFSMLGTAQVYIPQGAYGNVLGSDGNTYNCQAKFGAVLHNDPVWIESDIYTGIIYCIQIPCPAGTATHV